MVKKSRLFLPFLLMLALLAPSLGGSGQPAQDEFAMPGFSPYYQSPPVQFRGNRIVSVIFKTRPEVLRRFVPAPLLPNPFDLMFAYVGRFAVEGPDGTVFTYHEAGIGVPALYGMAPGNYAVCLYLDQAMPIAGGREIWGWPKKDAGIAFAEKEGEVHGRVERAGAVLLELGLKLDKKLDPTSAQPELPWYLLKIIPSARKDASPDVRQLVSCLNSDVKTRELWSGAATVKLGGGPPDDLGDIPVLGIVGAQFSVGDFVMGYGGVLHDYLAAPSGEERSADEAAVRRVNADLDEAWNRRDAAALAALFMDDADFQWPTGELLSGRQRIDEHFAAGVFKQMPVDLRHLTTIQRLRFPATDIVIGDGTIVVARENPATGEKPHFRASFTSVGLKRDGRWRIAAVRMMPWKDDRD